MKPSEKPTEKVDQFFKNKLDNLAIAPPENAWTKVEVGLSKKNNVVAWRWAAAVLLMGALISLIYVSQRYAENTTPALAEKKIDREKSNPTKSAVSKITESKALPSTRKNDVTKTEKNSTLNSVSSAHLKVKEIPKGETIAITEEHKQPLIAEANQIKVEEKLQVQATPKTELASSYRKPIKLEFTLEDLPSKETVATTNEAKKTGLKKVLELAREMKQGEGPLISLREKKDELLAHNFLGKKERTQ